MIRLVVFSLIIMICCGQVVAQQLTFTRPQPILSTARSDKAPSLIRFNEQYVTAWKDTGAVGQIHVSYLAQQQNMFIVVKHVTIPGALSAFSPVLQVGYDHLYLFWVGPDGRVQYRLSTSHTEFDQASVYTINMPEPILAGGISATLLDQSFMLAAHANSKDRLMLAACRINTNGILDEPTLIPVKGARSDNTPIITALANGSVARVSWVDHKKKALYYADYTPANNAWQAPQSLSGASNTTAMAIHSMFMTDHLIWIWKENTVDGRLRYLEEAEEETPEAGMVLPDYFSTNHPVAIAGMDKTNLILIYTGTDQHLYLSYATQYNPASWIGDVLLPSRKDYSLKDIVIPGAHDAGMSILTGVGGKGEKTINECNTLTQVQTIDKQLKAGIRMFDLRIDQKKGELFTKHAPSDCMDDAIGGGYGEKLSVVLSSVRKFLDSHTSEFVILSFCHFCTKTTPLADQAKLIMEALGKEKLFNANGRKLPDIKLSELAGKVVVTFENYTFPNLNITANSMSEKGSNEFINYRREYAATNQINQLLMAQKAFFTRLPGTVQPNDLIRLDWQLTEASQEAIFVCNDFQTENANPLVDGFILLANTIKKNKSIRELSLMGSRYLPGKMIDWINENAITRETKPNILYVDVAGTWITDFCITLNKEPLYRK